MEKWFLQVGGPLTHYTALFLWDDCLRQFECYIELSTTMSCSQTGGHLMSLTSLSSLFPHLSVCSARGVVATKPTTCALGSLVQKLPTTPACMSPRRLYISPPYLGMTKTILNVQASAAPRGSPITLSVDDVDSRETIKWK